MSKELHKKNGSGKEVHMQNSILCDIARALEEIRYGSVQIHIQDGKIVQIDKINKLRVR
ncbi:MAG: YezD family protein [Candidatus Omnitrophica bacterium]|nr:YezD family protein [Candidatus Omnitrophota bacterium]